MGLLTNIQRFSLVDGPGIRSTVFFKGCNMRCAWCHNPETISLEPQLMRYPERCIACGACVAVCDCFEMKDGVIVFDPTCCDACGDCVDVCFTGALELCGQEYTVEAVMAEVLQDKAYYEKSGGGVTLSGGEVLLQADFALELLAALRQAGVQTAIETNFSFPFETIMRFMPLVDLWMIDVKLKDPVLHEKWTGSGNARVLENIKRLDVMNKPFIIRTPVIPGVNDNEAEIGAIASELHGLKNLKEYELLNFNPLGASKYNSLIMDNVFADARPLEIERMEALAAVAREHVANVRIG